MFVAPWYPLPLVSNNSRFFRRSQALRNGFPVKIKKRKKKLQQGSRVDAWECFAAGDAEFFCSFCWFCAVNSKRKKKLKITLFSTSSDQVIYLKLSSSLLGESMPIIRRRFIACSLMVVGVIFLRCYANTHPPEYHEHEHRELRGSIPVHPSVEPVLKNNEGTIEMAKSEANVVIAEADHTLRQISGVMPGGNIAPPVV